MTRAKSLPPASAFLAELLGTFLLVLITGVACTAAAVNGPGLSDTSIALAFGLTVAIVVAGIAHLSGGHINPAVTLGLWAGRRIDALTAVTYIACQVLGGLLGAYTAAALVPGNTDLAITATLAPNVSTAVGAAIEASMAFFLVFTVYATAVDPRNKTGLAPLFIGLAVAVNILVGMHLTGASMNPARYLGPAVVAGELGDAVVYLAGPLLGGLAAAVVYGAVFLKHPASAANKDATPTN